jgi:hypothetical protein
MATTSLPSHSDMAPADRASHPDMGSINNRIQSYDERVDADRERFNAQMRRDTWRFSLFAVLGAIIVFGGGVLGFEHATRYRSAHTLQRTLTVVPAGATVVVINPG